MSWISAAGLTFILLSSGLLLAMSLLPRKSLPTFRDIPAFTHLRRAIGLSVEDGTRLHLSLGRIDLLSPSSASALAALSLLRRIAEETAVSDRPPVATAGDATLAILTQDTLRSAYQAASAEAQYEPASGRLTGLTPFSYVAGALFIPRDENISTNVFIGNFGVEVALLTEAAERENCLTLAATDNLPAQAILYATAQDPLIGEELYAAGAYIGFGWAHNASLQIQDILRWSIIILILGGAALKLVGLL